MPVEMLPPPPIGEQSRAARRQKLMVILANIGMLATGMSLGLPSITMAQLTDPNEKVHLNVTQASWFASINLCSTPLGALVCALILDRFGRKKSLYTYNLLALSAWALMASANWDDANMVYIQLLVARFVSGVGMGLTSPSSGVYAAEVSTPKLRGSHIMINSIAIAVGIVVTYSIGYFIRNDWQLIAKILCIYQAISVLCLIPLQETPSWLLSKGRLAEAKQSFSYFRGLNKEPAITHPAVEAEFNVLRKSLQHGVDAVRVPLSQTLRLPEVYKPLLILIGLFAFQQLCGTSIVIVYAVQISQAAGVSIDPFVCAVLIGVGRLVTNCTLGVVFECWGRRRSSIVSAVGICACMLLLAAYGWCEWLQRVPYLPVAAIVAFVVLSTIGIYTLPFLMISELFPQKVRGPATGLTIAVAMFFTFLSLKTYPSIRMMIGDQCTFLFFGVMAFLALIYVYLVLPETRGRTLLEIEEEFRSGKWRRGGGGRPTEEEMQQVFTNDTLK